MQITKIELENLNKPMSIEEIKNIAKKYADKRHQLKYQMVSQRNCTKPFQGIENDRKIPNFLYTANILLILKPDKKSTIKK